MNPLTSVRHRARGVWLSLTSSLWFIPITMLVGAILIAMGLVEASTRIDREALSTLPRLFGAGAAGSRGMLSTIAGSVITVAGVSFSITIAALALASAQYTPRVLRTFMGDRANQLVLGTFVGVFAYCLVVLRTIRGGDEGTFVPSIAVLGGFVLAIVSVGVLIFFIHHIAAGLQASTILDRVRRATERAIDDVYPTSTDADGDEQARLDRTEAEMADADWTCVSSPGTGYVQSLDEHGLIQFAREHGVVVKVDRSVGDFVTRDGELARFARPRGRGRASAPDDGARHRSAAERDHSRSAGGSHDTELTRAIAGMFLIEAHRTVEQDVGFGILQIVDIALKALSPGINDTTTAATAVDQLAGVLSHLGPRRVAPRILDGGNPCVLGSGPSYEDLVGLAFHDIRRNAASNVRVLVHLFDAIEMAAARTVNAARREILLAHVELIAQTAEQGVVAAADRRHLARRAAHTRQALTAETSAPPTARPEPVGSSS